MLRDDSIKQVISVPRCENAYCNMEGVLYRVRREGTLTLGAWLQQESQQRKLEEGLSFAVGGSVGEYGIMETYQKKKNHFVKKEVVCTFICH